MEGECLQLDTRVLHDVGFIVEEERDMERIGISEEGNRRHEPHGEKVPPARGRSG
jgi:hypothetical protein